MRARIVRNGGLAVCISSTLLLAQMANAQQQIDCKGLIRETHHLLPFDFTTSSSVEPANAPYKNAIAACVYNADAKIFLRVRWPIPGVDSWIPPHTAIESARHYIADDRYIQLKACLEYGNRGDTTETSLFGTSSEKEQSEDEQRRGCRDAVANPKRPGFLEALPEHLRTFLYKSTYYYPSNANSPETTMLKFEATVGAEIKSYAEPNSERFFYTTQLSYHISPYEGSKGVVSDLILRPSFTGPAEQLLAAFKESNPTTFVRAVEKGSGSINFHKDLVHPLLSYARFDVLDVKAQPVGSIEIPVLVSGR